MIADMQAATAKKLIDKAYEEAQRTHEKDANVALVKETPQGS